MLHQEKHIERGTQAGKLAGLCGSFFKSRDIKVIWLGLPRLILKTGGVIGLACVTWLWKELTWADPAD